MVESSLTILEYFLGLKSIAFLRGEDVLSTFPTNSSEEVTYSGASVIANVILAPSSMKNDSQD